MKSKVKSKVAFLLLASLMFFFLIQIQNRAESVFAEGPATTWTVDDNLQERPNANFTKIQDAANVAISGDTILVYPGIYSEGNIQVVEGVTLNIIPGVTVKFSELVGTLAVYGQLIARGTESEPIIFTSNQTSPVPGDWVNIVFADSSIDATYDETGNYLSGSIIQYCTIEYAGRGETPAVKIVRSSPLIDYCTISNNANGGIYTEWSSPRITNNIISDNSADQGGGIRTHSASSIISDNIISNNSANSGGGIYTSGYYAGKMTILNNTISNNSASMGGGVYTFSTATIISNIISGNSADQGGGIYTNYNPIISYNIISNNSANNGGGIYTIHRPAIHHNEITSNTANGGNGGGISIHHSPTSIHSAEPTINYNNIYDNLPYDIYNANPGGSSDINTTNNWWGTADSEQIAIHIYDWYDDASLGIVDYIPHLIGPVNLPPVASFAYFPENPYVGQVIIFNASNSYDPDGGIASYEWGFGDETNDSGEVVTHVYSSANNYPATLTVTDDDGTTDTITFLVTVEDVSVPTLTSPQDISYEETTIGHNISWTSVDNNPETHVIYKNNVEIVSDTWFSGVPITISVDGLLVGSYNYTIIVSDIYGNTATDTVIVTVVDTAVPVLTNPADITYAEDTTGHSISWTVAEINNPGIYIIFKDSVEIISGSWTSGVPITISVDGLTADIYNYTIIVFDEFGNSATDTVIVTIEETEAEDTATIPPTNTETTTDTVTDTTTEDTTTTTSADGGPDTQSTGYSLIPSAIAIIVIAAIVLKRKR